ncbi:MAG TPA: hypothetical protein VGM25_13880 [Caulobacteraceae bacterium]|jgi:hypothetical protein
MAKVVYATLNADKKVRLASKSVRDQNGCVSRVHTIDADSASFGAELSKAFRLNVRKARQENKRLTGAPDRVAGKR